MTSGRFSAAMAPARNPRRVRCLHGIGLIPLLTAVLAPGLGAAVPLDHAHVAVEVDLCRVEVEFDDLGEPTVRATDLRTGGDVTELLEVGVTSDGATVGLLGGEAAAELRIAIRLVLQPQQRLRVSGTRLEASIVARPGGDVDQGALQSRSSPTDGAPTEHKEDGGERTPRSAASSPAAALISADLTDSSLRLEGLAGDLLTVSLVADGSNVIVDRCLAGVDMKLARSVARMVEHRGSLQVNGERSTIELEGGAAESTVQLSGGTFSARDGSGTLQVTAENASLHVEQWRGVIRLNTSGGAAEIARPSGATANLTMTDTYARLLEGSGTVDVACHGGSFGVDGFRGPIVVRSFDGAAVSARQTTGDLRVDVSSGAGLRADAVDGAVTVKAQSGSVAVDQVASLGLEAVDSDLDLRRVGRLRNLVMRGCTASLDLRETLGRLALTATTQSRVGIDLAAPCEVRATGAGGLLGRNISCSGCDLRLANHPPVRAPRNVPGVRRAVLVATLDEGSSLTIRGR